MMQEYTIKGTTGIKIEFGGHVYTTVEDIHYEQSSDTVMLTLKAQCTTDDAAIMRGESDEESDWFAPEAEWTVSAEDLDSWIANGDWTACFDGVIVCD